jgi:hypothetical protein
VIAARQLQSAGRRDEAMGALIAVIAAPRTA